MIKGIIFDFDGTLVDSLPDLAESVNYALKQIGFEPFPYEVIQTFIGGGMRSLIENALKKFQEKENISSDQIYHLQQQCLQYFLEHYEMNCTNLTDVYFGVEDFLKEYHKEYQFAILTNKSEYFTYKIIKHLNLFEFFTHILTGDKEIYKKPKPAGIQTIQRDWKFHSDEVLMVGDHHTDIRAAQNAKIKSVFAMYGYGCLDGLQPNYSIKEFIHLRQLLKVLQ